MALIECHKCGNLVSNLVSECAQCGTPIAAHRVELPNRNPGPESASYAAADRRHLGTPFWAYAVFLLYAVMFAVVLFLPLIMGMLDGDTELIIGTSIFSVVVLVLGASLLVIPVSGNRELPDRQRPILFPLIGSSVCAALLFVGATLAAIEFWKLPVGAGGIWLVLGVGGGIVWTFWFGLFSSLSRSIDRDSLGDSMYQWLLAGSVLELLVAIPMHIIVRRRGECCAGQLTAMGIGIGVVVMFIALGPAVFFLFYRRYKQVYAKRRT